MSHKSFYTDVKKFNTIYDIDSNDRPTLLPAERLKNFHNILSEEVEEVHDILAKFPEAGREPTDAEKLEVLTDLSDWLGDLVVYCSSEARRWGLPMNQILDVIMQSNFSKLDSDGSTIKDERGKVMKGPGYWKPEPKISEILDAEL